MVDVSKYIDKAEQEVKRRNFDHAMTLYREILQIDPDCGDARSGIRMAAIKKFEKRYPSALERGALNLPARLMLFIGGMCKAHGWIVSLCEAALSRDPKNPKLNHKLGHALLALGYSNSAEAAFRVVTEFDAHNIESLKILGRLYTDRKELDSAIECYEKALKINPRDQEAGKMRKNLAAEGAIQRGGYETAAHARDLAKSERQMREAETSRKIVRTKEEIAEALDDAKAALEESPDNLKNLVRLAKLQIQDRAFDDAVDTLLQAQNLDGEYAEVEDLLGDARIRRFESRIGEAEAEAKAGEDGAEDRLRRLNRDLLELQIVEGRRRVAAHPTDMSLRFRLGSSLLKADDLDEAIEQFQQAVKDPKHRVPALHLLGRAFANKGILDLAVRQLREAADKIGGMTDQRKEVLYDLAQIHERAEATDLALGIYKEIYEADISYRDVGQRIQTLSA
ncbi:MAG: tetratricopeptide repeat protein [Planctomycetes bacterium]|nr:tetratricopeptide repeat protein [Planctomycetota bacterium]